MRELSMDELVALSGGNEVARTMCGVAVGATVGATLLYSGLGFALTFNKALAACTAAYFLR